MRAGADPPGRSPAFLCISGKSRVGRKAPFLKQPEVGAALGCGQASVEAPLPSPWKAWPVREPLCGGLTVQLVLREAGPAQVPHGVESYGVGLGGWSGRGWGQRGPEGDSRQRRLVHTPPPRATETPMRGRDGKTHAEGRGFQIPELGAGAGGGLGGGRQCCPTLACTRRRS